MSNETYFSEDFDLELWTHFLDESMGGEPQWVVTIYVVSIAVLFILSVLCNLVSCIVIYCDKSMHTATNFYLLNLAVSDLLASCALWLEIDIILSDRFRYSLMVCKLYCNLIALLWNNSILTMTALAIERYIAIQHPMFLKSTPALRRVIKVIALIWILAIAASVPEYFSVNLVETKTTAICLTMPTKFARVLNAVLVVFMFVLPLVIMTYIYVMIAVRVSKMEKSTIQDQIFNHRHNSSKVNKLLVALTLSFVICWLPFFMLRTILFACNMDQLMMLKNWFDVIFKLVMFNSLFGMVLNPVLFSLKSSKFRKALKAQWNIKFKKKLHNSAT